MTPESLLRNVLSFFSDYPRKVERVKVRLESQRSSILDSWSGREQLRAEVRSELVRETRSLRRALHIPLGDQLEAMVSGSQLVEKLRCTRAEVESLRGSIEESLQVRVLRALAAKNSRSFGASKNFWTVLLSKISQLDEQISQMVLELETLVNKLDKYNELVCECAQFLYLGWSLNNMIEVAREHLKSVAAEGGELCSQLAMEVDEEVRSELQLEIDQRLAACDDLESLVVILEDVLEWSPSDALYKCKMHLERYQTRGHFFYPPQS